MTKACTAAGSRMSLGKICRRTKSNARLSVASPCIGARPWRKRGPSIRIFLLAKTMNFACGFENCGFKLVRISGRMALKYTENRDTLHEVLRRSRTKMYDYGAVIRYCAQYGGGLQYCFDAIPYIVSFSAVILLFVVALPLAIYFDMLWMLGAAVVLLAIAVVVKKRSVRRALLSVAGRAVSTFRTLVSFVKTKPKPVEAYPTDVIHVR